MTPGKDAGKDACEDVFLSYAREDAGPAGVLIERLRRESWSVFFDRDIRNGTNWRAALESKLQGVKCILVLWSENSVKSHWVVEEADYGLSRQALAAARIDECSLPIGFRAIQTDDIIGWSGEVAPAGLAPLLSRVRSLIDDPNKPAHRMPDNKDLLLGERAVRTEHISVSDLGRDKESVLQKLPDVGSEIRRYISHGYNEFDDAQRSAREALDDLAAIKHYAAAAVHFKDALDALGPIKTRIARDQRSIEYFLTMELANSLAFSEPVMGDAHKKAIAIYQGLSEENRYSSDAPIFFRLGSAQARAARDEESIQTAIRNLTKARRLAQEADERAGKKDELLSEGNWLYFDVPRQLGICYFRLSELLDVTPKKRAAFLDAAIQSTRSVLDRKMPASDPADLIKFTLLKANGNLIYLLAKKIRDGLDDTSARAEIGMTISKLKSPSYWSIVENQVRIIDSIAFAAATIEDWQTAMEEAHRNIENFGSISLKRRLDEEECEMLARAKEILFFSRKAAE